MCFALFSLGLIAGFILGMARFIAEYVHPTPACNEIDNRPLFASMNFMYFGRRTTLITYSYLFLWCRRDSHRETASKFNVTVFVSVLSFSGIILFFVTVFIIIIVSLMTKPIPLNELSGLTWKTLHQKPTEAPETLGICTASIKYTIFYHWASLVCTCMFICCTTLQDLERPKLTICYQRLCEICGAVSYESRLFFRPNWNGCRRATRHDDQGY